MRLCLRAAAAALLATTSAGPALAQQAGITYDCDTASGNFSELVLPAPPTPFTVSGHVRLNKIAKIDKFAPLTRLTISGPSARPGETPADWAGFEITALPAKALARQIRTDKEVLQFLSWAEMAGGDKKAHDPSGPLDYPDSLSFTLSYDGSSVSARIAGQEQKMAMPARNPVVRIVCSTGEFLFTDLTIAAGR